MSTKLVVSIRPFHRTTYAYEKLQVCSRCGQYTCLWEEECTACGRGTLNSVQSKATSRVKRRIARDLFITILFGAAATYFGETIDQTMAAANVSPLCFWPYSSSCRNVRSVKRLTRVEAHVATG